MDAATGCVPSITNAQMAPGARGLSVQAESNPMSVSVGMP